MNLVLSNISYLHDVPLYQEYLKLFPYLEILLKFGIYHLTCSPFQLCHKTLIVLFLLNQSHAYLCHILELKNKILKYSRLCVFIACQVFINLTVESNFFQDYILPNELLLGEDSCD